MNMKMKEQIQPINNPSFPQKNAFHNNYESIKEKVNFLRIPTKGTYSFQRNQRIAEIIINDLKKRGQFYYNSYGCYYFYNGKKELFQLNFYSDDTKLCISNYGILSSEPLYKYIFEALLVEARKNGKEIEVYNFAYFNPNAFTLYIYNHNHQIYKITPEDISLVNNGTDGVLFLHNKNNEPFELVKIEPDSDYLDKYIVSEISLEEDILTLKEGKILFTIWFLSLFFESIMPTKVILAFIGEKGSSKTTTARKIGLLFFGSKFDVTPVSSKPDDFDTAVTNNYYVVFDNADGKIKWLNDKLATVSTGQNVKKRKLYTDNVEINIPTHCFVALTSRAPHFRREDVADRLIIMKTKRLKKFKSEQSLMEKIHKNRNKIMTYVIYKLQEILKRLRNDTKGYCIGFRMADFGEIAIKVAPLFCTQEEIEIIFDKMSQEQSEFTLEDEPIFELLNIWIERDGNKGQEISMSELFEELRVIANNKEIEFPYENPRALAQRFKNIRSNLEEHFNISDRKGGGNKTYYKFRRKQVQ